MKRKVRLHPLPAHVHENEQLTALYQHLADTVTGPIKMALKAHGAKLSASDKGMWLGSIRKRICGELTSPSSITAIRLIFESTAPASTPTPKAAPASTPTPKAAPGSAVLTVNAFIRKWLCDGLDEEVEIYENNPEFIADLRRVIEPRPNKAAEVLSRLVAAIESDMPHATLRRIIREHLPIAHCNPPYDSMSPESKGALTSIIAAAHDMFKKDTDNKPTTGRVGSPAFSAAHALYDDNNVRWQHSIRQRGGWTPETAAQVENPHLVCQANKEGDCEWNGCPQLRDGEPMKNGRWCPIDRYSNVDEE